MLLLIISFIAGVLTILAPCTLPLLPVIIGSSVAGESSPSSPSEIGPDGLPMKKKRGLGKAFVIAASLGVSVVLFTLLLKFATVFINIPPSVWQIISGIIILFFGFVSLFPELWEKIPFVRKLNTSSNKLLAVGYRRQGFWGDVIIGASLGPVFSTCSPTYFVILATVLPQSFLLGFVYLIAYAVGLAGVLLLVAYLGQKLVDRLGGVSDTRGWFKKGLGILFIIIGILVIFGIDKKVEQKLLDSGLGDITKFEQKLLKLNDKGRNGLGSCSADGVCKKAEGERSIDGLENADIIDGVTGEVLNYTKPEAPEGSASSAAPAIPGTDSSSSVSSTVPAISVYAGQSFPKAPELVNPSGYINTSGQPITIGQFKGNKVVLLDIWTYSCINCKRTLPYLKAWDAKYRAAGLEIIGVHTPEFAFEKVQKNVEAAVKEDGIAYPVVMDNKYATWNAFGNNYWPRKYLINSDGGIVYDHIGEGDYAETEREIQKALTDLKMKTGSKVVIPTGIVNPSDIIVMNGGMVKSPEVYFGSNRNQYLANGTPSKSGEQSYQIAANDLANPANLKFNGLYLDGTWNIGNESATAKGASKIVFKYNAKNVYMVASSQLPTGTIIDVRVDGKSIRKVTVSGEKLYTLVEGTGYGEHVLEIYIPDAGFEAFTFTFG